MNLPHTHSKPAVRGFTLLEVMIAMVIFSIGLLGLAGLQARGLQSSTTAQFRTIATIQAYDMADRIRANARGVTDGNYNAMGSNTPGAVNCFTANCSAAQMAQLDHHEWNTNNANALPSGRGTVTGAGAGSVFTIRVFWDEDRTGALGTNCPAVPDPQNELKCYQMVFEP